MSGQHDVEHDQVGTIFLDHHAGVEAVVDAADFEAAVAFQHVDDQFDQFFVVVDDQDLPLAAFQGIGRDAVVAHEQRTADRAECGGTGCPARESP